jgi:hypothetical protein
MISLVIVPESTKVTIEVPADMVNKRLYVDIHEEEGSAGDRYALPDADPDKLAEVKAFYATMSKDLGDVKFDRDETYER